MQQRHALELLAASLHGMLTSSANKWFSLRFRSKLNDVDEAEWLEDATSKMYDVIAKSNFQQEIFETYHDLIAFGTACLMIEEDDEDVYSSLLDISKKFIFKKIKKFCRYII